MLVSFPNVSFPKVTNHIANQNKKNQQKALSSDQNHVYDIVQKQRADKILRLLQEGHQNKPNL